MRVAFVTTMKPPDAPVPSGDRTFARLIMRALEGGGHEVLRPSDFSTWRAQPEGLDSLLEQADTETQRALQALRQSGGCEAVLTYHNYHKGPDLIGPRLARAFDVPYAIVEASRAPRRASGPWAQHFALADEALRAADAVGAVTRRDRPALDAFIPDAVLDLRPFIDTMPFGGAARGDGGHIVCAAMMRGGRKAESLRVLAEAYRRLQRDLPQVRLTVAGDGPERAALKPLFPPGTMVGLLETADLAALFASGDVFVWPAIDEPFGFVFLEAQAAGLPVVGGASPGVLDVVRDGITGLLVEPTDAEAIAGALRSLLTGPARRARMAAAARAFAHDNDLCAGIARVQRLIDHAARRHHGGAP